MFAYFIPESGEVQNRMYFSEIHSAVPASHIIAHCIYIYIVVDVIFFLLVLVL